MLQVFALLFGMVLSTTAAQPSQTVPLEEWEPQAGAVFLVDTKAATGYLINQDGSTASIPVLLGQNRTVHYLGRSYLATTPEAKWVVHGVEKQGDHITFGKEGTFLRLYRDGEKRTPYGIHTHAYFDFMLGEGNPYRSMGCVLVSKAALEKIESALELNNNELKVVTVYGIDPSLIVDDVPDSFAFAKPNPERATMKMTGS